uniref:GTPase IMAP family member 2-like n=1 Tax=Monopterus albus TaxID=43700 RepID=UPI0009B44123|nr:GTPase IMAP family member 2-like [Monopterus albus]
MLGKVIRLVDTPDFFDEQLDDPEAKIEECKRFCQPGRCVVLLVIQLGRFTESEVGILERLEDKLGWRIRHSTVVLLTHGEDFNGSVHRFISERTPLKQIVEACGHRCHMFRNSSRESRQVIELFKKIPDYDTIFPKLSNKRLPDCNLL